MTTMGKERQKCWREKDKKQGESVTGVELARELAGMSPHPWSLMTYFNNAIKYHPPLHDDNNKSTLQQKYVHTYLDIF